MNVIAFGECMIELSGTLGGEARLAYGGDSFNTALYMARLGEPVAYATALGDDGWSAGLRAAWRAEAVDTSLVLTAPGHLPGLYAIRTDAAGERSFDYWRQDSAAGRFFALPGADAVLEAMASAELLYLTGISLSLFDPAGHARLLAAARAVRSRGGDVAFDPNYRPRGWPCVDAARAAMALLAPAVSIALPGFDDEALLHGDATPEATVARWLSAGAREVVVKQGRAGALVGSGGSLRRVAAQPVADVIDTTGAGDGFNAGYLAARRRGLSPPAAAARGAALAAEIVRHPGAIVPRGSSAAPD